MKYLIWVFIYLIWVIAPMAHAQDPFPNEPDYSIVDVEGDYKHVVILIHFADGVTERLLIKRKDLNTSAMFKAIDRVERAHGTAP